MFHPSVTTGMPFHHLRVGGFPCEDFSNLKRRVTHAQLLYSLMRYDWLIESLRLYVSFGSHYIANNTLDAGRKQVVEQVV